MKIRNGEFSGKGKTVLGKVCAYMLSGVNVVRSVPEKVKVTITDDLLNRRARFSALSKVVKSFAQVFVMNTLPKKPGQNYRNPATSLNAQAVSVSGAQVVEVDAQAFVLSKGSLATQPATASQGAPGDDIVITWTASTAVGATPTDTVYVVFYNNTKELVASIEEDARSSNGVSIPVTGLNVGDKLFIYTFVKSSGGSFWSDSLFIGGITVA
jgi:hypothetical protein